MTLQPKIRSFPLDGLWCVHSYYTLCPYAPDGSGRILAAGANVADGTAEVLVLSSDGGILDRFGKGPVTPSFWHTGFWQSWSPDAKFVYYQSGTLREPRIVKRELSTGKEVTVDGDMEGLPPSGEPGLSCKHGLLYAAGYGDGLYKPEEAPIPFQRRDLHGLAEITFSPPGEKIILTTEEILEKHPQRDRILVAEQKIKERLGPQEGLTLMIYCVRWNPEGSRFLFYFGNHCVVKERQEPRIAYVFTADRNLREIHLAMDLSFGRQGVHWGWQPDNERLIGYGPHPNDPTRICLAEVRFDGSGYRMLSEHCSGGHPSVSPADPDLLVTDEATPTGGAVVFISRATGKEIHRIPFPKFIGEKEPLGRNPLRICHHPVFNQTGDRILCNTLPGPNATLAEIHL